MDSEEEVQRLKKAGQDVEAEPAKRQRTEEVSKDDLVKLWSLVQERYNSSGLTEDKEIELWVKLKILFEPNAENLLELHKYMHDPLKWWLYDMCVVHHISTEKGQDIFMLVEKDYPLTKRLATLMLCNKLKVDQRSEMADELLIKIYNIANRPRKGGLLGFRASTLSTADRIDMHDHLTRFGDYEMWKLRIEQYFQVQDYQIWEVIEYGNSFKPLARTTTNADGTSTSTIPGPVTTEEKAQKKNDVKARSMLLMALPNEHQLTFNQYKDAKTLFEAIQARFGGNEATKKTQKTLLKQMYENFSENISQEDLNFKFLRSLPSEWSMHVVVWRNKPDLGTISFDDLYNNFKIVEQEVKRSVTSSSNSSSQNVAFVSTPGSTNEDNTANVQDSTASTHVSTASTNNSTASLSDATVYAFLANQPNGSQVVHEDLEQIHEDDLEEMDLKWQLALLSLKARKFYQRTGKKIIINGSDTAGYDKSKVECFNCHKMGHFARECRGPRNQESRPRNQESSKRTVNVEDTSSKAMVAFDGAGFDWSFMADEEVPTNLALMAFSDSEVYNHKTCSDTCLKSYETLKSQYDSLRVEFNKSEFDLATYKRGLASVEEQLVFYKKNELNKLIGSKIVDKSRKGAGFKNYNAVAPLPAGLFAPPTIDLSRSCLKEFQQPEFEDYGVNVNKSVSENSLNEIKKTTGAPIIEDWVYDCDEDESKVMVSNNVQYKSELKPEQDKQPRKINENPRNNKTNWNEKKTQKLGVGFQFTKKAYFGTGQREVRLVWNNALRTNHQNFSNSRRNFAPTIVLTKSGIVPISTARQSSSRAATPLSATRPINTAAPKLFVNVAKTKPNVFQKAHSLSRRPFNQQITLNNISLNNKVNTAKVNSVNTAKGKRGDLQVALKDTRIFNSGCSRHMTGNKSYLTDYQDYDGGFVAFVGSSKGELKFNLFSVSQTCDKKNSVLFTETECLILLPDFKLPDENQVMLKIPRKDNMYSFDLKNVVPSKGLTCLIAKATNDESNMWHRRLGHMNFETMNKLVKGNLVRGSGPEWLFDIDTLTNSMNYHPVNAGNRTNGNAGLETNSDAGQAGKENVPDQEYILLPLLHTSSNVPSNSEKDESSPKDDAGKKNEVKDSAKEGNMNGPGEATNTDSTNRLNTVSSPVNTVSSSFTTVDPGRAKEQRNEYESLFDPLIPDLEDTADLQDTGIFGSAYDDEYVGAEADLSNLETNMSVSPIPITRIHKDHPKAQIIGEVDSAIQIEAIRLFLAFASFMGFTVYQMDVKSAFLYGTIEEEVYVNQPPGFVDPEFPNRVYKVEKALYGLHQAPRAWYETLSTYLLENRFRRGTIDKTLFIKKIKNDILLCLQVEQEKDGNFLSQDKYVYDILKKFGFSSVKTASTPMETHKPLSQDTAGTDVDVHLYRSMIGSLMYLTSSRPDIMFVVCACSRFQVQPKASHMHAVKRIFRYLKGQPTLGLWYPKDSPMDLIAYSDSDYAGASIDRKSTTGGCQFLGCRLISWQCKKQTIMANSTTEAEYIAASNCCG
ncbi:putative ribonuclease H-like domain-containing protein [Tanacetum coccineum]